MSVLENKTISEESEIFAHLCESCFSFAVIIARYKNTNGTSAKQMPNRPNIIERIDNHRLSPRTNKSANRIADAAQRRIAFTCGLSPELLFFCGALFVPFLSVFLVCVFFVDFVELFFEAKFFTPFM